MNPHARTYRRAFVMTGDDAAGWAKAMAREIHEGLCAIGIASTLLRAEAFADSFASPIGERYAMIDLNNKLQLPGVRKFSVMVDHPCTRIDDLIAGDPRQTTLGWVDLSHLPAAAALSVPYRSTFLPHAGPDPVAAPLAMRDRPIDIFFSGMLTDPWTRESWAARHPAVPPLLVDIVFETAERLAATLEPVLPIFIGVCADRGIDPQHAFSREVFCWLVTKIHEIAELNRRHEVLERLPDLQVTIAANLLPARLKDRPNTRYLGYIDDFDKIRQLMAQSKIVLNTTSKFPSGSHERIWYGMAEGAVLLTDRSSYLDGQFEHDSEILYLPPGRIAPGDLDYLGDLAGDCTRLDEIAGRSALLYREHHTWKQRATIIDEAINAQR
jgi:hypothetical protein